MSIQKYRSKCPKCNLSHFIRDFFSNLQKWINVFFDIRIMLHKPILYGLIQLYIALLTHRTLAYTKDIMDLWWTYGSYGHMVLSQAGSSLESQYAWALTKVYNIILYIYVKVYLKDISIIKKKYSVLYMKIWIIILCKILSYIKLIIFIIFMLGLEP